MHSGSHGKLGSENKRSFNQNIPLQPDKKTWREDARKVLLAAGKIERLPCRRAFSPAQIVPIRYKYVLGDSWVPDPKPVVPVTLRHSSCPSTNNVASEANLVIPGYFLWAVVEGISTR